MKLTDLDPRWLGEHVFAFLCPHCRKVYLTCKDVQMSFHNQRELAEAQLLPATGPQYLSVLTVEQQAWCVSSRDFATMTVTPSIDASKSGHWHGFIRNGEIA